MYLGDILTDQECFVCLWQNLTENRCDKYQGWGPLEVFTPKPNTPTHKVITTQMECSSPLF